MKIGSLFSGIGGLELGLEAAGLGSVIWQVECDPFCLAVLAKHWPEAQRFKDVCHVDETNLPAVDLLCGGFPCQDVSAAGKRLGLAGSRSGLWHEYARLVGVLRPRAVVVENVTSGERSWLPRVQHDLVSLGYRCEAWRLGASDVGAPHRRMRTFVIAVGDGHGPGLEKRGVQRGDAGSQREALERAGVLGDAATARRGRGQLRASPQHATATGSGQRMADADRRQQRQQPRGSEASGPSAQAIAGAGEREGPDAFGPVGRGVDGLSGRLDGHRWPAGRGAAQHEGEPPRTAQRKEIPRNKARLKALGNAVVPQVARLVGLRLRQLLGDQSM